MGLFKKKITDQLYAGSQFFQNGRVAGKPKDRRDFYAKAIEALRGNRLMLRGIGLTDRELNILGIKHAGE